MKEIKLNTAGLWADGVTGRVVYGTVIAIRHSANFLYFSVVDTYGQVHLLRN